MNSLPPLALYAHFPWCVRKCPYCDFNSHQAPAEIPEQIYVQALLADLDHDLELVGTRSISSMFFGGGTPSLFSPEAIARFIEGVRERIPLQNTVEITLEANPGTIERGRFAGYREAGVTRVSLGVQSFDDAQLKQLGRIHQVNDVLRAVDELRAAGLDNFNLDLMYALPQQSLAAALHDVQQAIALHPAHLSHYQLTLEPGTPFHHNPPVLPDADDSYTMQLECQAVLEAAGYQQYEISAYAQPNRQCMHNRHYWEFGDYLGVGAGAHGKLTQCNLNQAQPWQVMRTERTKNPRRYLAATPSERLTVHGVKPTALPFEFMLNTLRLRDGFPRQLFEHRTGLGWHTIEGATATAIERQLIEFTPDLMRPTPLGLRFLNDLQALYLPD